MPRWNDIKSINNHLPPTLFSQTCVCNYRGGGDHLGRRKNQSFSRSSEGQFYMLRKGCPKIYWFIYVVIKGVFLYLANKITYFLFTFDPAIGSWWWNCIAHWLFVWSWWALLSTSPHLWSLKSHPKKCLTGPLSKAGGQGTVLSTIRPFVSRGYLPQSP